MTVILGIPKEIRFPKEVSLVDVRTEIHAVAISVDPSFGFQRRDTRQQGFTPFSSITAPMAMMRSQQTLGPLPW